MARGNPKMIPPVSKLIKTIEFAVTISYKVFMVMGQVNAKETFDPSTELPTRKEKP